MGDMRRVVVMVVWAAAGLGLAWSGCVVDESVKDLNKRLEQENLLQTLSPIMGESSGEVKDEQGNTYEFVVCADFAKTKNVSLAKTSGDKAPIPLGYNNHTLVSSDKHWLMLTFLGGPAINASSSDIHWEGHVLFICDPDQSQIDMKVFNDPKSTQTHSPMFIVRHRTICSLSPKGLSGGTIFFILLLVTFTMYFTFGFFYLRLVKGAKGIEQIPNRNFWFRVGNLIADGCEAVFRCDRYCGAGERPPTSYSGYSSIDEHLAQDLQDGDRDSALLSP